MTDEVLAKIDNVDSVRFRLPDGSEVSYNEFLIMRNNTIGGTEPLQFHNKLEVARNFDDAKQIAYLELRKLFDINDVESIPKDLWSVFYKLDVNGEILYVDKDGKNHELSENNEYTKLITQYQYLQYNSLMDKKHVSTDLFSVKDGK